MLTDGDVALFFNEFERLIQVTIIQKGSPGFYETVRVVQPLQAQLSPRIKLQDIESHRLFSVDMSPPGMAKLREETQSGQTLTSITKWGPKIAWNSTSDIREDTATNQAPFPARQISIESNPHLGVDDLEATELAKWRDATTMAEGKWKFLSREGCTAVIPKKRRCRGALKQKILIKWRNVHYPMRLFGPAHPSYSD